MPGNMSPLSKPSNDVWGQGFREVRDDKGNLVFRMAAETLRRLEFLVRQGIKAIPCQGLEIGGLVIAASGATPDSVETLVDLAPVSIQYWFGPKYRYSEADHPAFEEALAHYPEGGDSRVVGCYRSHLADRVEAREEDRRMLQQLFGDRGGLLILVQASMFQRSVVHFYERTGGADPRLVGHLHVLEIPSPADASAEHPVPSEIAPRSVESLPWKPTAAGADVAPWKRALLKQMSLGEPDPFKANRPKTSLLLGAAALFIALLSLALILIHNRAEHTETVQVGLSIRNRGPKVELSWNGASPAVKNAVRGSINIVDSGELKRFDLNTAQMRSGRYEYTPVHSDLICQVMFYQPDNSFAGESAPFHVNLTQSATANTVPERANGAGSLTTDSLTKARAASESRSADPPFQPLKTPSRAPAASSPDEVSGLSQTPQMEPPPAFAAAPQSPRDPVVHPEIPAPAGAPVTPLAALPDTAPDTAPVIAGTTPDSNGDASQAVVFRAPVPLRRVAPAIPPGVRSLLQEPVSIRVVVEVNREGKVTGAMPGAAEGRIEKLLAPHAVQAARLWQFEPALRDGVPVAGETSVVFRFAKE
jgi:hypothetical protein